MSGDCPSGELCFEGSCRSSCISDDECPFGYCDLGVCHEGEAPPFQPPARDGGPDGDDEDGGGPAPSDDAGSAGNEDGGAPPPPPTDDGGVDDAGGDAGSGPPDAGPSDGGAPDAGPPDAGSPDAGLVDPCAETDPYGADLDGDCLPDVIVSAPGLAAADGQSNAPSAIVSILRGQADGTFAPLGGFLSGASTHGRFGESIVLDERKDANGKRGFFVGEPHPLGAGVVHRFTLNASNVPVVDVVAAPAGVVGFGQSVALAGDDGQGPALGVGALSQASPPADGVGLFSFAGDTGALRNGDGAFFAPADLSTGALGATRNAHVARVPDADGDGRSDFAISGAGLTDASGAPLGVFLVSSATLAVIRTLPVPAGAGGSFGAAITGLPDYDGDGVGELAIGAPDNGAGHMYVAFSSRNDYLRINPANVVSALAGFGAAIAVGGDFDGDGIDDVAIGAPFHVRQFEPPVAGAPDLNAPLAQCAELRGDGYSGNCAGAISVVLGARLVARSANPTTPETAIPCLHGGAGGRMGTALRALGPAPQTGASRLAYGAPGLSDRPGFLGIFTGTADPNGCLGDVGDFTLNDGTGTPVNGLLLGTALGQ